jgi:cullin-associated NEDD8-dissociated protein 1
LGALKNLVLSPSAKAGLDQPTIEGLANALLPLITTSDLHLLGPALLIDAKLVEYNHSVVTTANLEKAVCNVLLSSLSGAVLDSVLVLVSAIGKSGAGGGLMKGLLQNVSVNGDPAVVGKVIGTLLVTGGNTTGVTIDSFLGELNAQSDDTRKSLALAVLGEAGLRLGAKSPLQPDTFFRFFSGSPKVSMAAALALGRAGAGNIATYVPFILQNMDQEGPTQYLLLHSVKEILLEASSSSLTDITQHSEALWNKLVAASQAEDSKAAGAECVGRLAILNPTVYMPKLQVCT